MEHSPGFLSIAAEARARIRETDVAELRRWLDSGDDLTLIDVREESEWHAGRIAGAQHLGKGIIERDIEERVPDKRTKMVLYCGGGYRSALAADSLQRMGYENVISMNGGMRGWEEAGHAVETGGEVNE